MTIRIQTRKVYVFDLKIVIQKLADREKMPYLHENKV